MLASAEKNAASKVMRAEHPEIHARLPRCPPQCRRSGAVVNREAPPYTETMATLAVCVIALDEEDRIGDCLASVAFADEILVVDSGSTDRTVAIARERGARVVVRDWPGYVGAEELRAGAGRGATGC